MHPDLVAHLVGPLTLCGASLRSSLAEIPTDLVVGHRRAVLLGELHEGVEVLQIVLACHVVDSGHDGGADRLILDGVENGLKRGVKRINAVGTVNAVHPTVILHPGVNGNILALTVGDSLHGAVLLGKAINHAINMDASSGQSRAHRFHRGSYSLCNRIKGTIANIVYAILFVSWNRALCASACAVLANGIGGLAVSEKHNKLILAVLGGQQVGRQLEAGLGVGSAASSQIVDHALGCITALLISDIHHCLHRVGILRILHHRDIARRGSGGTAGIQGIAIQEGLCGLLCGRQTAFESMRSNGNPLAGVGILLPEPDSFRPLLVAVIADAIAIFIHPFSSPVTVAFVNPFITGRTMILAVLLTAGGTVAHGTGGINDQDGSGIRVSNDRLVLGGDFQIYVEEVLGAGLSEGALDLDCPVVRIALRTVRLVIGGAASIDDLICTPIDGKCRDLHQAQAHDQGHEQAQCPLADGLAPGDSLAGIVFACHDSFPP